MSGMMSNNEKYVCINCVEQIAEKDTEIERLRAEVQRKEDANGCLRQQLHDGDKQLAEKDAEIERLRGAVEQREFEIQQCQDWMSLHKEAVKAVEEKFSKLADENCELQADNERLRIDTYMRRIEAEDALLYERHEVQRLRRDKERLRGLLRKCLLNMGIFHRQLFDEVEKELGDEMEN